MSLDTTALTEDSLLTTEEVAELLRLSPGRLRNLRCQGRGPVGYRIGRSVRYSLKSVRLWVAAQADPAPSTESIAANPVRSTALGPSAPPEGGRHED